MVVFFIQIDLLPLRKNLFPRGRHCKEKSVPSAQCDFQLHVLLNWKYYLCLTLSLNPVYFKFASGNRSRIAVTVHAGSTFLLPRPSGQPCMSQFSARYAKYRGRLYNRKNICTIAWHSASLCGTILEALFTCVHLLRSSQRGCPSPWDVEHAGWALRWWTPQTPRGRN